MRSPSETVNEISRNNAVAPNALVNPCAFKIGGIYSVYRPNQLAPNSEDHDSLKGAQSRNAWTASALYWPESHRHRTRLNSSLPSTQSSTATNSSESR